MIKLLFSSLVLFSYFTSHAATWTFHGCKDNYTDVRFVEPTWGLPQWRLKWDWNWDQAQPVLADSGISYNWTGIPGYSDVLVFDVPEGFFLFDIYISSPFPDYENGYFEIFGRIEWVYDENGNVISGTATPLDIPVGEYWIDYDSVGQMRIATSASSDFGKWEWNGSVNPNYVEPPAPLAKKHGKGHNK